MLENLALRQQLAVFKRPQPRPRLGAIDRLFWVVAGRFWAHWKKALAANGAGVMAHSETNAPVGSTGVNLRRFLAER